MPPGVSLSKLGLRIAGSLDCPAGGRHDVPEKAVIDAAARGGGTVPCLRCRQTLTLERT